MTNKYVVGETYYKVDDFGKFLYQKNPYYEAWECVGYENEKPLFKIVSPKFVTSDIKYVEGLKTKEEATRIWENETQRVTKLLKDSDSVLKFMVDKIEELYGVDEYGTTFTTVEIEMFKEKLKEFFGLEIDI